MSRPENAASKGAIAQACTVVLADTGHMLMLERPDAVIDALKDAI